MRLLILTQKVDKNDPILGFFHRWIKEFAKKFEKVMIVCLEKGEYDLPVNVQVFSLGKEAGISKIKYVVNFFRYITGLAREYDAVFVHMNQEYVLLGGLLWKLLRKRVYLWRNHPKGNFLTTISVWLSNRVFATSEHSFAAKFKKTRIMSVGIDTEIFKDLKIERPKNSILFLGRVSPIKRPELLTKALGILKRKGINFICDFYGDPLPKDATWYEELKEEAKGLPINFHGAVPNYETPKIYNSHQIYVNLTPSGSMDKTILEAAACGCLLVLANKSLEGEINNEFILDNLDPQTLAVRVEFWQNIGQELKEKYLADLKKYVLEKHSLEMLADKLCLEIKK